MTKAELIKALEPFRDDQECYVRLYSNVYPDGCQVAIQGVKATPPWREAKPDESNFLIGIEAHDQNRDLYPDAKRQRIIRNWTTA